MKMAEPRKLFGRPSTLLLDEKTAQPSPPPIHLDPAPWRSLPPRSPGPPPPESGPPVGVRIRSVASLPDELEDPDEMEDTEDYSDEPTQQDVDDGAWGAAFEVDDFRAARRDPDEDLIRTPALVHMPRATVSTDEADDDDVVAMPEEGDEGEVTGVGEQVAMPDGFDFDFDIPSEEAPEDSEPDRPGPPAVVAPGPTLVSGGWAAAAPGPRVLTDDPVEGLAVAWMSASAGDAADLPDIVDDHHSRGGANREARMALLETAVFGEAQPRNTAPPRPVVEEAAWSPESAPGPEGVAPPPPSSSPRSRYSLVPQSAPGSAPPARPPAAPAADPAAIPDAVAALAEAMQRDTGPSNSLPPRVRRATGEPPRILRRGRETPPPTPPPPPARATRPMFDPDGFTPRRLSRPAGLSDDVTASLQPAEPEGAFEYPDVSVPTLDTSRRTRPPPAEHTAAGPRPRPQEPAIRPRPAAPQEDGWGPAHRNADGRGRAMPTPSPLEMPASRFELPDLPAQPPRPLPAPYSPNIDRGSPPRAPGPRGQSRNPPRVTRVAQPARLDVNPILGGVALIIAVLGVIALVLPRLRPEPEPPSALSALPEPDSVSVAPVEAGVDSTPVAPVLPADPAPVPTKPTPEGTVKPVAAPQTEKASAYRVTLGMIRVTTDRKALIILDGKQQGYAPGLADLPVVPGQHTVRAVVPGTGVSRSIEIRVDAGTATIAAFSFAAK